MFIALYRWKLKKGKEKEFRKAWSQVTLAIREQCGSLGSRLHRAEDGTWVGYAQWPTKEMWEAARLRGAAAEAARARMRAAIAERFPSLSMTVSDDYLISAGKSMALDHIVLEVSDVDAAVGFYRSVFGFAPVRLKAYKRGKAPFPSVRMSPATVIDLFPKGMWRAARKSNPNHFCVAMTSSAFGAWERRLGRLGVKIVRRSDHNFGARGFARSAYVEDPDGNTIEARYYPA
jgi:catechol 2,3-dioxygenase-like lactoylglutathione lyase family enzyme/heme-degrading monooxygenase HmoA